MPIIVRVLFIAGVGVGVGAALPIACGADVADRAPADRPSANRALADHVAAMVSAASEDTVGARGKLDRAYREAKRSAPDEPRVDYAYALALAEQHRPVEASRALAGILAADPRDWRARRAKIHVDLTRQRYGETLDDLKQLAAALPAAPGGGIDESELTRQAEFLGHAFSYLKEPRAGCVDGETLARIRAAALLHVGADREGAFVNAELEVASLYRDTIHDCEVLDAEARDKANQQNQIQQRQVDRQKAKIESAEKHVDQEAATLRRAAAELADIEARLTQLREQATWVDAQASLVQASVDAMRAECDAGFGKLSTADYRGLVFETNLNINARNADLRVLGQQQTAILAAALPLEGRRQALLAAGTVIAQKATGEVAASEHAKKLVHFEQKKLSQRAAHPAPSAKHLFDEGRRLVEEAKRFDSYDEFPLKTEQDRVLRSLRSGRDAALRLIAH